MFGGGEEERARRYKFETISGYMREKSHKNDVQKALNEGANRGWELVSASYSMGSAGYSAGLFWDTTPPRH